MGLCPDRAEKNKGEKVMFIRFKKQLGGILAIAGFFLLLGMAGTDDVAVLNGVHAPIIPLLLKGILFLSMMVTGAVLIGGAADENCD